MRAQLEDAVAEPAVTAAVDPPGLALGRAVEHLVQHLPPKERACVLLKDVFDYSIDESADLVDSTPGGVKAALHRGGEKLTALPPPATVRPAAVMHEDDEPLLRLYDERFNRRDSDGLRSLIAADATLRVADWFEGRLRESPYFARSRTSRTIARGDSSVTADRRSRGSSATCSITATRSRPPSDALDLPST